MSFEEELERQKIRDEERERLKTELEATFDRDAVTRNLTIAIAIYAMVAVILASVTLGLAFRLFVLVSGL